MRTTVQLPAELLRAAKTEAAARGETLKGFLTRAVANELGNSPALVARRRVELPLVGVWLAAVWGGHVHHPRVAA